MNPSNSSAFHQEGYHECLIELDRVTPGNRDVADTNLYRLPISPYGGL
ncbi:MAG: hypothetical protein ABEK50_15195 [bacterium]